MRIIALSGSLRAASFNTQLANELQRRAPDGVTVDIATCHGIPLYDGDLEAAEGIPDAVTALSEQIQAHDGLILVTPEYNGGMPGVFKNTLDWLTRPADQMKANFHSRPTGLVGATPGGLGTTLAQSGALVTLRQLKVDLFPDHLRISRAHQEFDDNGELAGRGAEMVESWLAGFAEFVSAAG